MDEIRSYQGDNPIIGDNVYVDRLAVITGLVTIDQDSSVWPFAAIRGDATDVPIHIGERCNIQEGVIIHLTPKCNQFPSGIGVTLGDDVIVGHHAALHGCTIGNRVMIGMKALVMDGAVIEDDVIIAAASVIPPNKRCLSGYLYLGSPARPIRKLTEDEIQQIKDDALLYVDNKNKQMQEGYHLKREC